MKVSLQTNMLCACLVTALVFIGKNFAIPTNSATSSGELSQSTFENVDPNLHQHKRPILAFRPNQLDIIDSTNRNNLISGITNVNIEMSKSSDEKMSTSSKAANIMSKVLDKLTFRLPQEIRPKHYNLFLNPDLSKKTFTGNVKIFLNISKPISYIPVHSKYLNITTTEVKHVVDGELIPVPAVRNFEYAEHEYWVTEFDKPLNVGEYEIDFEFNSNLADRIIGFYQSSYFDSKTNTTKQIATSKFEPTFARQAFPCFDEPAMKATYQVTLRHPNLPGYHALSNMDIEEIKNDPDHNYSTVRFRKSVPMSTYLACFIISDFQAKNAMIDTSGIGEPFKISVYATPAQIDKVDFALQTGKLITEYYIKYFNISYPLSKLDMVAIPDFVSGAMEHWGLVTYRETSLLYNKQISATSNKQRVGTVIAHELAHMWFGNLVTMKWWNDLWLNEGFASYIEYKGLNVAYPDWDMMTQFLVEDLHAVLNLDATLASHPIVQIVENPNQITELFDTITYQKGAAIIRMLENFVGDDIFQDAVTNYLKKFSYNNAVTDDLLTEIEAIGLDFDVKLVMETWTQQMGLPVVNVEKIGASKFKLTQKRFFSNPENEQHEFNDSKFNYKWYIPVTYVTNESSKVQRQWFKNDDAEIMIELPTAVNWIKFNKDQIGYYRVNYPQNMWKIMTDALCENTKILSTADRAHLLNDAFALADATQLSYDVALELTRFLKYETEYVPWSVATSQLSNLANILYYTDVYSDFRDYGRKLIENAYKQVGWTVGNNHSENLLRTTIIGLACRLGVQDCIKTVQEKFRNWLNNSESRPSPDLRSIIYYYGMATIGDETEWFQVWDLFINEEDASEKLKLMQALAAIRQPWILRKYIDLAWDQSHVRRQDYFTCMGYISSNRFGEHLVWDYVREHWPQLVDRFGLNERYLGRMIPSITRRFSTKLKLSEMEIFFQKYPEAGAGASARKTALETVRNNIKWLEANKQAVAAWLKSVKNL